MSISKRIELASGIALVAGASVGMAGPSLAITAHADTAHNQDTTVNPSVGDNQTGDAQVTSDKDAYNDVQGDEKQDTNDAKQHSSKAFEYMTPEEGASSWKHKEDWQTEPGTDNTQTDWAIAENANGKTASDTSAKVYGDTSEARFNPGDHDNRKMTSLKWTDRDADGDGEEDKVEGPINPYLGTYFYDGFYPGGYYQNGESVVVSNNNNNNNNNNNSSNNGNNANNLAGANDYYDDGYDDGYYDGYDDDADDYVDGVDVVHGHRHVDNRHQKIVNGSQVGAGNNAQKTDNKTTQIGQNMAGNDIKATATDGRHIVINGGNASGLPGDGNGTYVIRTADGESIVVSNNNNNNNSGNNGNNNNGSNLANNVVHHHGHITENIASGNSKGGTNTATNTSMPNTVSKSGMNGSGNSTTVSNSGANNAMPNTISNSGNVVTADNNGTNVASVALPQTGTDDCDAALATMGGVIMTSLAALGISKKLI